MEMMDDDDLPTVMKSARKIEHWVGESVVFIPFYLIYAAAAWLFCNINVIQDNSDDYPQGNRLFYQKVQEKTRKLGKLLHPNQSRVVIFMSLWLIANLSIPRLKNKLVLGSELWKWTLLVMLVLCGYHLINMVSTSLFCFVCMLPRFKKKKRFAYYVQGMRQSVNLVALAILLLLMWDFYFTTSHGIKKTDKTKRLLHVLTWTIVGFAVMSVLWLVKSALLLKWEAYVVYRRYSQRLLAAGSYIYFLGYVYGWTKEDRKITLECNRTDEDDMRIKEKTKKKKQILCCDKDATLYDIQKMAESFIDFFKLSSTDGDETLYLIRMCWMINTDNDPDSHISLNDLVQKLDLEEDYANMLYLNLQTEHSSRTISYRQFETSLLKAENNCVALGSTLSNARELGGVLNSVMFAIGFIVWLILTDIATTKIFVIIASPFLAVIFIFGDTFKKIFEGIIFSCINHPFDVGDRCIVNKTEVEVTRMEVLTTTFLVIGTREQISYPNSALATMPIVNLKDVPAKCDSVEFALDSSFTKSMLDQLEAGIISFFRQDNGEHFERQNSIVVKEIGDRVKMELQFGHVMSIDDITHSECLMRKRRQKSMLLLHIKQLIDQITTNR